MEIEATSVPFFSFFSIAGMDFIYNEVDVLSVFVKTERKIVMESEDLERSATIVGLALVIATFLFGILDSLA